MSDVCNAGKTYGLNCNDVSGRPTICEAPASRTLIGTDHTMWLVNAGLDCT